MKNDIAVFCKTCLHFLATTGGKCITCPMGHGLHGHNLNEIIHFDLLFMGKSDSGQVFILILKGGTSGFVWPEPCTAFDSGTAVRPLVIWFSLFEIRLMWISDGCSHFKNKVMDALNHRLHAHHQFTTPCRLPSSSTVETVCEEVLWSVSHCFWNSVHKKVSGLQFFRWCKVFSTILFNPAWAIELLSQFSPGFPQTTLCEPFYLLRQQHPLLLISSNQIASRSQTG